MRKAIMTIGAMNNSKHVCILFLVATIALCYGCQYNQQQVGQTTVFAPKAVSLGSIQTPNTWSMHNPYSAFSISVPNSLEMSNSQDRYSQQLNSLDLQRNNSIVIFQPKSLNKGSIKNADEHYCRVLINYEKANPNELLHSYETAEIDADTRAWLYENVKSNLAYSQQLLSMPSYQWVDIGGTKAIRVVYRRSGNDGNTTACAMYYLYNNDEMAVVMTAYREQEADLWQTDMENVIRTFRWNQNK